MTYDPLATDGKATVDRFLFSASVRQFLTAFSRLVTASSSPHDGLWTCSTCLHGSCVPEPLIAAGKGEGVKLLKNEDEKERGLPSAIARDVLSDTSFTAESKLGPPAPRSADPEREKVVN